MTENLKIYKIFFIFTCQNMCPQNIGNASEVLRAKARPISVGHAIFSGLPFPLIWRKLKEFPLIVCPLFGALCIRIWPRFFRYKKFYPLIRVVRIFECPLIRASTVWDRSNSLRSTHFFTTVEPKRDNHKIHKQPILNHGRQSETRK